MMTIHLNPSKDIGGQRRSLGSPVLSGVENNLRKFGQTLRRKKQPQTLFSFDRRKNQKFWYYWLQVRQMDEALGVGLAVHVHVVDLVEPRGGAHLPLLGVVLHLLLVVLLLLLVSGVRGSKSKLARGLGKCLLVGCNLCFQFLLSYKMIMMRMMMMSRRCWSHKEISDGIRVPVMLEDQQSMWSRNELRRAGRGGRRTAIKRIFGATDTRRTLSLKSVEIFNKSIKFLLHKPQKVTGVQMGTIKNTSHISTRIFVHLLFELYKIKKLLWFQEFAVGIFAPNLKFATDDKRNRFQELSAY